MTKEQLVARLKTLTEQQMEVEITSPDQTIEIDSFTMMLLITVAEAEVGVQLDMDVLNFDDPTSLNSLSELILSQR